MDLIKIKSHFPILNRKINGHPLTYLDSAATSLTPTLVIQAITKYYETHNANVHRGIHTLSEEATLAYEDARQATQNFINAASSNEIIFTGNTTEAINLISYSWGNAKIKPDDEIIISELEHHANLIPWQQLAERKKAKLKVIPVKDDLSLDLDAYISILSNKTKVVAITGMSNVTGTIPDLKKIIDLAHQKNAITVIDAAQLICHQKIDVQDLNCDFLAFSGHKMLGPTGIGVLYGKEQLLQEMPPFLTGGSMIKSVTFEKTEFASPPQRFEAGTPNIAAALGLHAAISFINEIGMEKITAHDQSLINYAKEQFKKIPQVQLQAAPNSTGLLSFTIDGVHPHDIASIFNELGIAIRAGHHCCQPLMKKLGLTATARLSTHIYNDEKDIDSSTEALKKVLEVFKLKHQ